uniref:Defense protein 1-like n=1 Tax=Saccoglossus kowalevskii TaxID=10224 RepID=A0ABM0MQ12_SACKO
MVSTIINAKCWCHVIVFLTLVAVYVCGFGTGAPQNACGSMIPQHGEQSGTLEMQSMDTCPYSLNVSRAEFEPGEEIYVEVTGDIFRGILVQAHEPQSDTPVGTFGPPPDGAQHLACSSERDSLTHTNSNLKTGITFTWIAPQAGSIPGGAVEFVATIVQSVDVFWTDVLSQQIYLADSGHDYTTDPEGGTSDNGDLEGEDDVTISDNGVITDGSEVANEYNEVSTDEDAAVVETSDDDDVTMLEGTTGDKRE